MCEQGVTGDVFVGCYYLLGADPLPSGAALIRGQAESRLLCFLPCFSGFGAPRCKREGRWGKNGAKEKQPNGHLPMIQGNPPQDDWKVRMSHFPLAVRPCIIPPRYRWVPGRGAPPPPFFFQLPSNHSDMASHLPCVKKQLGEQFDFE